MFQLGSNIMQLVELIMASDPSLSLMSAPFAGFGIMSSLLFGVVYAGLVLITDMRDLWQAVGRYVLDATVVACTTACVGFLVMTTSAREVRALPEVPTMLRNNSAQGMSASMCFEASRKAPDMPA